MRWPDVTRLGVKYLAVKMPDAWVSSRLPSDLQAKMPVVRVTRGPGSDDGITDSPLVDVETFTADEATMWQLAEDARGHMHSLAHFAVDDALVDSVNTTTGPTQVDYAPGVYRSVASYRLALRKR